MPPTTKDHLAEFLGSIITNVDAAIYHAEHMQAVNLFVVAQMPDNRVKFSAGGAITHDKKALASFLRELADGIDAPIIVNG